MESKTAYIIGTIIVMVIVTLFLRFSPFVIFGRKDETPELVSYLGSILPFSIMGMLVVFCLRHVEFSSYPHGIPEAIALLITACFHLIFKKTLLSVIAGTASYMILVQVIFV